MTHMHAYQTFITRADPEGMELKMLSVVLNPDRDEDEPPLYQVTIMAVEQEKSHHISCATRRPGVGVTQCDCTPVAYGTLPPEAEAKKIKDFSINGQDLPPAPTEWTLQMWPRRSNVDHFEVKVVASSADEALSRALSAYPGHAWEGLTDTERPVRRLGDNPQA